MDKLIIGYTSGVYDLLHIGHINLLRNAKSMCDKLVVGVSTDKLVKKYKNKMPVIPFNNRIEMIKSIKYVDAVIPQEDMDKLKICKKINASVVFVGDDWYGTEKWTKIENQLNKNGIRVIYLPYTKDISSTKIINKIINLKRGCCNEKG